MELGERRGGEEGVVRRVDVFTVATRASNTLFNRVVYI